MVGPTKRLRFSPGDRYKGCQGIRMPSLTYPSSHFPGPLDPPGAPRHHCPLPAFEEVRVEWVDHIFPEEWNDAGHSPCAWRCRKTVTGNRKLSLFKLGERKKREVSSDQRPWLFAVYRGWKTTQLYREVEWYTWICLVGVFLTYFTMVNHHFSSPFGRICFNELFPSIQSANSKNTDVEKLDDSKNDG